MKTNLILCYCLLISCFLSAQSDIPDETFGPNGDGTVTTILDSMYHNGDTEMLIQADGKIVVATDVGEEWAKTDFMILRYLPNGELDSLFGEAGMVRTDVSEKKDDFRGVAQQADGKILLLGMGMIIEGTAEEFRVILLRYNADGSLDDSFGEAGMVIGEKEFAYNTIAVQTDGKIVLGGSTQNGGLNKMVLARYHPDGSLDNSFGTAGSVLPNLGNQVAGSCTTLALQKDGKILAGGTLNKDPNTLNVDITLVRLNPDGTMDTSFSFGDDGFAVTDLWGYPEWVNCMTLQADGRIILGGGSYKENSIGYPEGYAFMARYHSNGNLDYSFGQGGIHLSFVGPYEDLVVQADGKLIVVSDGGVYGSSLSLFQCYPNGEIVDDYGPYDVGYIPFGGLRGWAVETQADHKTLAVGSIGSMEEGGTKIFLVRFKAELGVNVVNPIVAQNTAVVYPNPMQSEALVEYSLVKAQTLDLQLYDAAGKQIQTIFSGAKRAKGSQQEKIRLADSLPAGTYWLMFSSPEGRFGLQVLKN